MQRAPCQEACALNRTSSSPEEHFPEEAPRELATAAQPLLCPLGPQISLVQATWRELQEVVYVSGHLWR